MVARGYDMAEDDVLPKIGWLNNYVKDKNGRASVVVPLTTLLRPGHMISNFTSFLVKRMVKPSTGYYSYRHSPEDVQGDRRLVALSERFGTPGWARDATRSGCSRLQPCSR